MNSCRYQFYLLFKWISSSWLLLGQNVPGSARVILYFPFTRLTLSWCSHLSIFAVSVSYDWLPYLLLLPLCIAFGCLFSWSCSLPQPPPVLVFLCWDNNNAGTFLMCTYFISHVTAITICMTYGGGREHRWNTTALLQLMNCSNDFPSLVWSSDILTNHHHGFKLTPGGSLSVFQFNDFPPFNGLEFMLISYIICQ